MENDALKFRVFIPAENRYMDNKIDNPIIDSSGNLMWCYLDKIGNLKRYEHNLLNRERAVIERCTGLRDRNNKLIYEGDVVVGSWNTTLVVIWDVISSSYRVKPLEDKCGDREIHYYTVIATLHDGSIKCINFEIIGTIHDDQFRDAAEMVEARE